MSMENLRFLVNRTKVVLRGLNSSPFSLHQLLMMSTVRCIWPIRVGRCAPVNAVTRSSAKPCVKSGFGVELMSKDKRESMTRFQRRGESTPPCGVPLIMYFSSEIPFRE